MAGTPFSQYINPNQNYLNVSNSIEILAKLAGLNHQADAFHHQPVSSAPDDVYVSLLRRAAEEATGQKHSVKVSDLTFLATHCMATILSDEQEPLARLFQLLVWETLPEPMVMQIHALTTNRIETTLPQNFIDYSIGIHVSQFSPESQRAAKRLLAYLHSMRTATIKFEDFAKAVGFTSFDPLNPSAVDMNAVINAILTQKNGNQNCLTKEDWILLEPIYMALLKELELQKGNTFNRRQVFEPNGKEIFQLSNPHDSVRVTLETNTFVRIWYDKRVPTGRLLPNLGVGGNVGHPWKREYREERVYLDSPVHIRHGAVKIDVPARGDYTVVLVNAETGNREKVIQGPFPKVFSQSAETYFAGLVREELKAGNYRFELWDNQSHERKEVSAITIPEYEAKREVSSLPRVNGINHIGPGTYSTRNYLIHFFPGNTYAVYDRNNPRQEIPLTPMQAAEILRNTSSYARISKRWG